MNKIEEYKKEKDGLEILGDVPRYAAEGWQAITEGDKERLKWAGVFFRRQTPGHFMMRLRIPNGILSATELRAIGQISGQYGKGFADITTRQQIQLRWFTIADVPEIWERLAAVELISLQTGMDNVRGVIGCPVAGLTPNELFDASGVVREFTQIFVGNKAFTNLPRKFNVTITACKEVCTHAESQDLALTPATKEISGIELCGFNVAVGGKLGSGGFRMASPLNVFATPEEAAAVCSHIVMIFRDHGARELRTKARLAFLIENWGIEKFRAELERRVDRPLTAAGKDERAQKHTDHIGVLRQKQAGLNYVGLAVPVGRMTSKQMLRIADLAENYGSGQLRLTVGQNIIIPNVPDSRIGALTEEPVLQELRYDPSEVMRGLVSCTGMDYCHFALIDTKGWALKTARHLEAKLGKTQPLRMHWSGCPASCGNHTVSDIGLLGKNVKINGEVVEAVDVFAAGAAGIEPNFPIKILEDVPCEDLPDAIAGLAKHGAFKAMRQQLRRISQPPALGTQPPPADTKAAKTSFRGDEIAEGAAKLVRVKGEEMAVFKNDGKLYGIQNICPHEGGQLCNGWIEGGEVVCPLHGYKFDLKTGACSTDPSLKVKVFRLVAQGRASYGGGMRIVARKNQFVKTGKINRRNFLKISGGAVGALLVGMPKGWVGGVYAADAPETTKVRFGIIALTDCSSIVMAHELGLFKKYGIESTISKEASWAVIRDRLTLGENQATHMLIGMPYASTMGLLGSPQKPMIIPFYLNRNGQAITLDKELLAKGAKTPQAIKPLAEQAKKAGSPMTFAMTFPPGTHAMWMRYWLGSGGINPDKDVTLITIPPAQMVANMKVGKMDGFCVGEPWNARAIADGIGFTAITTQQLWKDHPEKVLAFTEEFADKNPKTVKAILRAMLESSQHIDKLENRAHMAEVVSKPQYINTQKEIILGRMLGDYDYGDGRKEKDPNYMTFFVRNTNFPLKSHGVWWLSQFRRWGMVKGAPDYKGVVDKVHRPDIFREVAKEMSISVPKEDMKRETLFDGIEFDPAKPEEYAKKFAVHNLV